MSIPHHHRHHRVLLHRVPVQVPDLNLLPVHSHRHKVRARDSFPAKAAQRGSMIPVIDRVSPTGTTQLLRGMANRQGLQVATVALREATAESGRPNMERPLPSRIEATARAAGNNRVYRVKRAPHPEALVPRVVTTSRQALLIGPVREGPEGWAA